MSLFQSQNRLIKEEKFNLNIHDVSIDMAGTVHQICHISPRTFKADLLSFTVYLNSEPATFCLTCTEDFLHFTIYRYKVRSVFYGYCYIGPATYCYACIRCTADLLYFTCMAYCNRVSKNFTTILWLGKMNKSQFFSSPAIQVLLPKEYQ
jgi:hypothetical protein